MRNTLGLLATLAVAVGPVLAHFEVTPPLVGFVLFALGGLLSVMVGLASLVQLVRGRGLTLGGGLGVVAGLVFFAIARQGAGHPRINDFTTDPTDPPAFEFAAGLSPNVGRDLSYPREFAAIQRACCPELRPAKLAVPPLTAYERALTVAASTPSWQVTRADAQALVVEAVATSRVFRFQDDIVIRVTPQPDGTSRVDMRSKSRDGKGDIGANTIRIRQFIDTLEAMR